MKKFPVQFAINQFLQWRTKLKRRKGREIVLISLYEIETGKKTIEEIINKIEEKKIEPSVKNFAKELFLKTVENIKKLDEIISKNSYKWKIERISLIDKNILRMAISEIMFFPDIPYKVSINEAVELAKKFATEEKSKQFINGVLGGIVREMKIVDAK